MFDGVRFYMWQKQVPRLPPRHVAEGTLPHSVALYDSTNLPELDVIQELTARESDFAHDQLIDVMGVCQFFLSFPFSSFSVLSDDGSLYHSLRSSTTALKASINSDGFASYIRVLSSSTPSVVVVPSA